MKYIITESKLDRVVIKYLNKEYGDLEEYTTDKRPDNVFFVKDKKVYMEQDLKNGYLYVDYYTIWTDLKNIFGLERHEIQRIIKKWVEETYKLRGVTKGVVLPARERRWMNLNLRNYIIDVKKLDLLFLFLFQFVQLLISYFQKRDYLVR